MGNIDQLGYSKWAFLPQQSFIGVSLDNRDLVEEQQRRHDACVTIPKNVERKKYKEMQFKTLDSGLYVLYSFYDTAEKLNEAYQYMFGEWLLKSVYQADEDRDNLEFNLNNPVEDPEGKCKVNLYVLIKQKRNH